MFQARNHTKHNHENSNQSPHYSTIKALIILLISNYSVICFCADQTTIYLVRHSEKNLNSKQDPALTKAGIERAESWAKVFAEVQLDAVYSTDTRRTRSTANPTAKDQNLDITVYSPKKLSKQRLLDKHRGKAVLIVGHSNTTPALVNALIEKPQFQDMNEASDFSSLFIVTLSDGDATAQRLHVPYTSNGQ